MNISGKTALLTGATGGIGRAIATSLAAAGARVVLSSRKQDELEALAAALPGSGHSVVVSDLAEPGAVAKLLADAGPIDILVANAALPASGKIDAFSEQEIDRALRVNLEAPIKLAHALIAPMLERGGGHLVFTASLAGIVTAPRSAMYNATKFGLRGFAGAVRQDLEGSPVGISLVSPGFIRDAGMFVDSGAETPPGVGTSTPQEVAAAVITAIEKDKAEILVAPRSMKLVTRFAVNFPGIAARATKGSGTKLAEQVTAGQAEKR